MNHQEYNGWTNYETWNVALWLDNDEGSCRFHADQADEILEAENGETDDAFGKMADFLQSEITDNAPDLGSTCYADLLGAALSEVNWYEIAKHYIDEAKERWNEEHAQETEDEPK